MPADLPPDLPPDQPPQSSSPSFEPTPFRPAPSQPPPGEDPFRSVWNMSPVADARAGGKAGRRRSELRLGAGLIGGLVMFSPFGLIASILWGWWEGEPNWGVAGWVTLLIGAAAGFGVAGFVASQS